MLVAAAMAFVLCVLPIGLLTVAGLEKRFTEGPLPPHADGIVVLGGVFDPGLSESRGEPAINEDAERLVTLVHLMRRYPDAKVVYSGGVESDLARQTLEAIGVDTGRIQFETKSSSTRQDAAFAGALAHPTPEEVWLLVTSAYHMPRSVGVFRALGWNIEPIPTGYRTSGNVKPDLSLDILHRLMLSETAIREWAALLFYRIKGWTDELYPRPAN
jgi:uncharacterized SAM-binding protein YcdF (DUF218 family)